MWITSVILLNMAKKLTMEERKRRRFSEAFRKEQVEIIESGQATQAEIARRYEVRPYTVLLWMNKYGKKRPADQGITMVGSSMDFDRLKQLQKENESLKILYGEQQIKLVRLEKLLELYKEELGEDFEKKV